jgi:glycosyltransferase involved in cell wall biosynthesis
MTRVAVVSDVRGLSGVADYARLLASALRDAGYGAHEDFDAPADVFVYNYAPYAGGVYLGWLRAVRSVRRLRRGGPVLVVWHEVFERPDERLRMRLFERVQRWTARRLHAAASAHVVADRARAARLAALVPGSEPPHVIPVGPNIPVPDAPQRAAQPTVVLFGLLHPDRDLETAIQAAARLRGRVPGLHMRVIGDLGDDPPRRERLEAAARELDAPVSFEGALSADDVASAFAGARAFLSTYTGAVSLGSGTIAVALGNALPVVVYAGADLHPELVPGRTVLASERTADALADVLADALGDEGAAVGAAGRALYERELTWPTIAERFAPLLG